LVEGFAEVSKEAKIRSAINSHTLIVLIELIKIGAPFLDQNTIGKIIKNCIVLIQDTITSIVIYNVVTNKNLLEVSLDLLKILISHSTGHVDVIFTAPGLNDTLDLIWTKCELQEIT
jgi:hypothetical protein